MLSYGRADAITGLLPSGGADACSSGADDLGPEFNGRTYRLKFMCGGRVIWVDVDAATGRILRRSRP